MNNPHTDSTKHISDATIDFVLHLAHRVWKRSVPKEGGLGLKFVEAVEVAQRMLARTETDELTQKLEELFGESSRFDRHLNDISHNTRAAQ